ncbi:SLAC1 anion channel family protein [Desulfobacula sp.]
MSQQQSRSQSSNWLQHFPITLFATVMGIAGLSIAFLRYEKILGFSWGVGQALLYTVTVWFAFLTLVYVIKWFNFPDEVTKEFNNPVKVNFFPAFSISLLLLSIAYEPTQPEFSRALWYSGAILHLGFTLKLMSIWFHKNFEIHNINPAWFIPVVGTILVPVVGKAHAPADISWFFFSIGIVFWIVLLAMIFYRLVFHTPLPDRLIPTMFILIAPPAVGFIAYVKMTGNLDVFARLLYYHALFTTILLFFMIDKFKNLKFFISWWAYTFPLDAITIASLLMYHHTKWIFFKYLTSGFLIIACLVILLVLCQTILSAWRHEICVPE